MLKRLRFVPIIVLLLAPVASALQESAPWATLNSAEGKFSVLMPTVPKVEVRDVDSALGKLTMYSYASSSKAAYFIASYSDYPRTPTDATHAERVIDDVRDGVLKSLGGEKISENKITVKGHAISGGALLDYPGREFTAKKIHEGSEVVFAWRIYLVGRRLYQLAVITSKVDATSPDVPKFMTSFQLTSNQ